jgi:purine nucleosidase
MMALNSADLDVLGLTTVGGNASLAHTTRNALRLLEHMGRSDIGVFRGAARPLRGRFSYAYDFHGPAGLTVRLPRPRSTPETPRAPEYIASVARSLPGELVLVALGPLTNIARTLAREPQLSALIEEIVVMGGAVEAAGNVTPHAEFNIYNDPHAAQVVFSSGIPVTLVGLDVCNQVYVARHEDAWLRGWSGTGTLTGRILAGWFASHAGRDRYILCDPLAVAATVRPELLTYKRATVSVELRDGGRAGETGASYGAGAVRVATGVRVDEAKAAIQDLLRGRGP